MNFLEETYIENMASKEDVFNNDNAIMRYAPDVIDTSEFYVDAGRQIMQSYPVPEPLAGIMERVGKFTNFTEASQCVDDMNLLEEMLKHAKQFGDLASQYCVLEAKMYIRISALEIKTDEDNRAFNAMATVTRRIIEWLKSKNDEEIASIMYLVSNGKRINNVRLDEQRVERFYRKQDTYRQCAQEFVDEYKAHGRVQLNAEEFYNAFPGKEKPNSKIVHTWIDAARNEILKAGGVGLGDGSGTYIAVRGDNASIVSKGKAISNRINSISSDINRLADICKEFGIDIPNKVLSDLRRSVEKFASCSSFPN